MKQFQVPQFITIEDKIIGPFTAKQFFYLLAGGGIGIVARITLPSFISIPIIVLVGAFALVLAFLKIQEQPFPAIVKNAIKYAFRPRLYIWRHEEKKGKKLSVSPTEREVTIRATPKLSQSRLTDLAWSLNIKDKFRGEEDQDAN